MPIRVLNTILPVGAPVVNLTDHASGTIKKHEGANYFMTGRTKPCTKEDLFKTEDLPLTMAKRAEGILVDVFGGEQLPAAMQQKDSIEVLKHFFLDVATSYVWYLFQRKFSNKISKTQI